MRTTHRSRRIAVRTLAALALSAASGSLLAPTIATASTSVTTSHPSDESPSRPTRQSHDDQVAVITGSASDPDDVDGRLDIRRVRDRVVQVDRTHYLISYRARTYTPFATDRLDERWRNFDLELDRDGAAGSERTIMVVDDEGVLEAQIISTATRRVLATVSVTRPNDQAVEITGPRRLLGARSYFWTSNWHADRSSLCGYDGGYPVTCQDSVPDVGWLRLEQPAWPDLGDAG